MSTRKYRGKTVEMVFSSKTIARNLEYYLDELSKVRSNWTSEYVRDLQNRIDEIINNVLGLDHEKDLRQMTNQVNQIATPALERLAFLKDQIRVDFDDQEAEELFTSLGYSRYHESARNNDTESLILFLAAFRSGMTEETRNRITAKGTTDGLIDEIIGYADQVADANAEQEYLKESAKRLNAEKQQMLNDLYEEIIGISKIARSYYRHDPVKSDGFTYSKVLARMRLDRSVEKESPAV